METHHCCSFDCGNKIIELVGAGRVREERPGGKYLYPLYLERTATREI
jgi:hypothetical protein